MTAPGIDTCSLVPLYVEAFFGDQLLGEATAFPWLRFDGRLSLVTNWHVVSGRNNETNEVTHKLGGIPDHLRVYVPLNDLDHPPAVVRVATVDADGKPLWVEHPEHGRAVDIAALDVDLPPPGQASVMPMNAIGSVALKKRIGMQIFILGYPFGRMGIGLPVWKQATLASEPYFTGSKHQRYLIVDSASVQECRAHRLFSGFMVRSSWKWDTVAFPAATAQSTSSASTRDGSTRTTPPTPSSVVSGRRCL